MRSREPEGEWEVADAEEKDQDGAAVKMKVEEWDGECKCKRMPVPGREQHEPKQGGRDDDGWSPVRAHEVGFRWDWGSWDCVYGCD